MFKRSKDVSTLDKTVLSSLHLQDISALLPCNHEEADTRLLLHALDATKHGHKKLMIRTVDADVLLVSARNRTELALPTCA